MFETSFFFWGVILIEQPHYGTMVLCCSAAVKCSIDMEWLIWEGVTSSHTRALFPLMIEYGCVLCVLIPAKVSSERSMVTPS